MKTKCYVFHTANGDVWAVPLDVIARDRAEAYAEEFDGDVEKALKEDTLPLFEEDDYNVEDWARNNMSWNDVEKHAKKIDARGKIEMQDEWTNPDDCYTSDVDLEQEALK